MSQISMKELLEAGVHFGHQSRRWNPKMGKYIFMKRKGIHIIDLQKTLQMSNETFDIIRDLAKTGGKFLFVGTKKQSQQTIIEEAARCNQFFIAKRWPGGLLTNFKTVQQSIKRLKKIEAMIQTGEINIHPKKIQSRLTKEKNRLDSLIGGVKEMKVMPTAMFVVDVSAEMLAITEAKKLNIPIFGIVDTDSDPDLVDYPIPGNDDAIRAISLFVKYFADAIIEGREEFEKLKISKEESIDVNASEIDAELKQKFEAEITESEKETTKPEESKPEESKPEESKPEESKPEESTVDSVKDVDTPVTAEITENKDNQKNENVSDEDKK